MKQLSAMGARRQFFRNPRRLRALRPGEDYPDGSDMLGQAGLGYFGGELMFYYKLKQRKSSSYKQCSN